MHTILLIALVTIRNPCAPPTPGQEAAIHQLIAATNTGDPQAIRTAARTHWLGADTSAGVLSRTLLQLGVEYWKSRGWMVAAVCGDSPTSAYVLAANTLSQETDSLTFRFEGPRVQGLGVWTGVRVPVAAADTVSDAARTAALRRYLSRLREAGVFSGAVLVRRNGRTLFADSAGVERRPDGRPIGLDSRINIASVGKLFTAASIMQLVARRVLSLDDTLGTFYPDSGIGPALRGVRLGQVLSHTSGIHDSRTALATAPGTTFFYSNLDFVLLGEILERASGERWEDYFAEHIFRAAGMAHTGRPVLTRPVDYLAMGYVPQFTDSGPVLVANPLLHTLPGNTAGALFSTAHDLARVGEALRDGSLLPTPVIDSMRTSHNTSSTPYGYGIMLWRSPRIWGHAGDLPGTDADLEILEPSGVIVVVLSNISGVNNPIRRRIARLWGVTAR